MRILLTDLTCPPPILLYLTDKKVRRLCVDYEDATPVWMQFSSDVVAAAQRLLPLPIALRCIWNR